MPNRATKIILIATILLSQTINALAAPPTPEPFLSPLQPDVVKQITANYEPGVLIVKFKPAPGRDMARQVAHSGAGTMRKEATGADGVNRLLAQNSVKNVDVLFYDLAEKLGNTPTGKSEDENDFGLGRVYVLEFDTNADIAALVAEFERDPNVEYAEPNYIAEPAYYPDDPYLYAQYALTQTHTIEAWDIEQGSSLVVIAVVDSGIDDDHEDFQYRLWTNPSEPWANGIDDDGNGLVDDIHGWNWEHNNNDIDDFIEVPDIGWNGHGTKISGIAAASSDNGVGIAGVCPNCRIMPLVARSDGNNFVKAIKYAADKGAEVINMSWTYSDPYSWLEDAINYAVVRDCVMVAAAGNDGTNAEQWPAAFDNVIGVAAVDNYDQRSIFSQYGYWVSVAAPGEALATTLNGGGYTTFGGTSASTPFVSGLAGLLRSHYPSLSGYDIQELIEHTSDNIDALNPAYAMGWGRINAHTANVSYSAGCVNYDPQLFDLLSWYGLGDTTYNDPSLGPTEKTYDSTESSWTMNNGGMIGQSLYFLPGYDSMAVSIVARSDDPDQDGILVVDAPSYHQEINIPFLSSGWVTLTEELPGVGTGSIEIKLAHNTPRNGAQRYAIEIDRVCFTQFGESATPTPTPTNTPTPSSTPTNTPTPTASNTPTTTLTPTQTPTQTATPTNTPTPTKTTTPTLTPTPSNTPTPTQSPTPSNTPTPQPPCSIEDLGFSSGGGVSYSYEGCCGNVWRFLSTSGYIYHSGSLSSGHYRVGLRISGASQSQIHLDVYQGGSLLSTTAFSTDPSNPSGGVAYFDIATIGTYELRIRSDVAPSFVFQICINNIGAASTATPTPVIVPTNTPTPWAGPTPAPSPTPTTGPPTPEPPQLPGYCDGPLPAFPGDDGSCGPDGSILTDPLGWIGQQLCKLWSIIPRLFRWLGWLLQWLMCPIYDFLAWVMCLIQMIGDVLGNIICAIRWPFEFLRAAWEAFVAEVSLP